MANKKTLLLVEDESSILFSVQRILELSGNYEVITAGNGRIGLEKLANTIPDLIISDIAMPEMDGIEFCKRVRESMATRSIPFIFLTAKKERLLEGIQTGSDDYVIKPFKVDELLVKIKTIFHRIENRREEALVQKGALSEYNLDEILQLCTEEAFTGELVLKSGEEEGVINLDKGEISKIKFLDQDEDQALDSLRKWQKGNFILRPKTIRIRSKKRTREETDLTKQPDDLAQPVQIADDTWWMGRRHSDSLLQTNVYLRQFKSGQKLINYLFNPGSLADYSVISQKITSIIGDISNIHVYNLNQQDAYITQNIQFIKKSNPKAICVTTEGNWRLLTVHDIDEKNVKYVNKLKDWRVKLATQHELIYISAPFCPQRSTFLTYDPATRVLFCGELFSGILNRDSHPTFWLNDEHVDGVLAYHQLHIPNNNALKYVIHNIKKLNPQPLIIAPLYGNLIQGEYVKNLIDKIYKLQVGSDLLQITRTPEQIELYLDAANDIIKVANLIFSKAKVSKKLSSNKRLQHLCKIENDKITLIKDPPERTLEQIVMALCLDESDKLAGQLRSEAMKVVVSRKLPPFSIGADTTETKTNIPRKIFSN